MQELGTYCPVQLKPETKFVCLRPGTIRLILVIMRAHATETTGFSSPGVCDLPIFKGMV